MKKQIVIIFVLLFGVLSNSFDAEAYPNCLVSYWQFDKGNGMIASDSVGPNDGTINGASWDTGLINGALNFDGLDDIVSIQNISGYGDFSMSAWFKPDFKIVDNPIFQTGMGYIWFKSKDGDEKLIYLITEERKGDANPAYFTHIPITISEGEWNHVVMTGSADNSEMRAYLNGELIGELTRDSTGWSSDLNYTNIGGLNVDGYNFSGLIDEVAVFSRVLSAEEIREYYQAGLNGFDLSTYISEPLINLPQTGQTTCYDSDGNVIDCEGTGQDGDIRAGVEWPEPRFEDNGNGTITDHLTGLIWLKNANCFERMEWFEALNVCNSLASSSCGLGDNSVAGDWHLPNIIQLESLINAEESNPASWLNIKGFSNVQLSYYWSATTSDYLRNSAHRTHMRLGYIDRSSKSNLNYVWPVRTLQNTGSAEPWKTGQSISYETGDDGDLLHGVSWPEPRFKDNEDGTVTDYLTGLVWLKNANCGDSMNWNEALRNSNNLASGSCGLSDGSVLGDWHLPNRKELLTLIDFSRYGPMLPQSHPFSNIQLSYYWSSTTSPYNTERGYYVHMGNGDMYDTNGKSYSYHVWPVRGRLPNADFTADKLAGPVPLTVAFTDTSTGTITSWEWDFGDGSPISNDQNPTHTYDTAGAFTVSLAVTGRCGSDTEIKTEYISVNSLDLDLIAYYAFDGNANDESGYGNHGTLHEDVDFAEGISDQGLYLHFDASIEPVTVPDADILDTDYTFTVGVWVKPSNYRSDGIYNHHFIVDKSIAYRNGDYQLLIDASQSEPLALFRVATGTEIDWVYSQTPILEDQWTHIGATFDNGLFKIFINGELEAEKLSDIVLHANLDEYENDYIRIGGHVFDPDNYNFEGYIDEVYIYNWALTQTEIQQLFQLPGVTMPNAGFVGDPLSGLVSLPVTFSDESTGTIDLWEWDFGDGSPVSNEQNPSHTYKTAGNYTVTLTITGPLGSDTETKTDYISMNSNPVADAGEDETVSAGENCEATVDLDGIGSYDPDGDEITYEWTGPFGTATGSDPTITLPLGIHTITLDVSDGRGGTSSDTVEITVEDTILPIPDIASLVDVTGECSASISSTPTATDNCAGAITGTTTDPTTYTDQGTHTVTWTYDDGNGNTSTQTQTVIVDDVTAPVPDVDPLRTVTGDYFAEIVTVPNATDSCTGLITGITVDPLVYAQQGTHTVTWTFDDGNGNVANQIQTVIVQNSIGGLVAYYPFENSANDLSGYDNQGNLQEGANFASGKFDQALDLHLSTSMEGVIVPDSDNLDTDSAFTLSVWVNPTNYRSDGSWNHHFIMDKWQGWPPGDYALYINADQPEPVVQLNVARSTDPTHVVWDSLRSQTPVPKNRWTHIAATFDNGLIKIFINRKKDAEKLSDKVTHTELGEYEEDYVRIGGHYDGSEANYNFEGLIDEVRIYNRALPEAEIGLLYDYEEPSPVTATRTHPEQYNAGDLLEMCVNITHDESLSTIGLEETIPENWTFDSVGGDDSPLVYPPVGTEGTLEFAWIDPPVSPADFCYTVEVPQGETEDKTIWGEILYRIEEGSEQRVTILPDPDTILACGYHCGDYNTSDWSFNLSELLRIFQFYNIGSYHCDPSGEDGYNPDSGDQNCTAHNSDYNPSDWKVDFSELLRAIQLYNVGAYHCDPTVEDGYAPGSAPSSTTMGILAEETLTATHMAGDYLPGNDLTFTVHIEYEGRLEAAGVEVDLPEDWTFVEANGDDMPVILPPDEKKGTLNFGWFTPPVSPIDFNYSVHVPAEESDPKQLIARVKYRRLGGEIIEPVIPDPLCLGGCVADYNCDGDVDGLDLVAYAGNSTEILLDQLAAEYGRSNCCGN